MSKLIGNTVVSGYFLLQAAAISPLAPSQVSTSTDFSVNQVGFDLRPSLSSYRQFILGVLMMVTMMVVVVMTMMMVGMVVVVIMMTMMMVVTMMLLVLAGVSGRLIFGRGAWVDLSDQFILMIMMMTMRMVMMMVMILIILGRGRGQP